MNYRCIAAVLLLLVVLCLFYVQLDRNNEVYSPIVITRTNNIFVENTGNGVTSFEAVYMKSKPERMRNIEKYALKARINISLNEGTNISSFTPEMLKSFGIRTDKWRTWRYDKADIDSKPGVMKGEIGCFLSHLNILQKVESRQLTNGWTVVFEDDFAIQYHFKDVLNEVLDAVNSSTTDIVYLGNCWQKECGSLYQNISTHTFHHSICYATNPKCTFGYAVCNKNAGKVHRLLSKNINNAVDIVLERLIRQKKLNALVVLPSIVHGAASAHPLASSIDN